jgi:Protein of unknown function (DUF2783)
MSHPEPRHLNLDANAAVSDDFFEALLGMHVGLNEEQSELLNAKIILLLANHIGDRDVLAEALALARQSVTASQ